MKKTDPFRKPAHAAIGMVIASLTVAWLLPLEITSAAEPGVVPTDPLPPQQQLKNFRLPPGFEIQLVVSEPEIGQPMNMNFDARGRLWITHTIEYPYPAQGDVDPRERFPGMGDHPPRDRLTVIEGIGDDGRPAKITHFADSLNIPIGVTPLGKGNEALVYSIPTIDRVQDTDGDGCADQRTKVYGRFGNIDTHGMVNSFTRWIDGWIYGCHGFANSSEVHDGQGNVVRMQSGNTYRFREDGSHFQQFTWGQVNPFGMTFDTWGNLYDADCHSMPIYLLLRGAYYPSFGKPHDGLRFGPTMIDHGHGSTGICGPAFYAAEQFPEGFRGSVFICNPVNGQVHHDRLRQVGSTMLVDTQPDFVTCEDGWFRPVDLQVGPDGALYIADFYNSVIGHYEVPLGHPKRDRTHGRIWRVVYTGTTEQPAEQAARPMTDLTTLSSEQLIAQLADSNLVVRTLATNWLVDSTTPGNQDERVRSLRSLINAEVSAAQRVHAMWVLDRIAGLPDEEVMELRRADSPLVRTHLIRILAERENRSPVSKETVLQAACDDDAMVRRVAADAMGRHPRAEHLTPLLELVESTPAGDTHLVHTAKMALRDQLRDSKLLNSLNERNLSPPRRQIIAELLISIDRPHAAAWLADHLESQGTDVLAEPSWLQHVVRYASEQQFVEFVAWLQSRYADDPEQQFRVLTSVREALPGGSPRIGPLNQWASSLASDLWDAPTANVVSWTSLPDPRAIVVGDPWSRQARPSSDGDNTSAFWSSLPGGEQKMGTLRSSPFPLPKQLSFYIAGHNGITNRPETPGNIVRLRASPSGEILREVKPPRQDVAKRVEWKLRDVQPSKAWLELIDGHDETGYAWLAVGRFSPAELNPDAFDARRAAMDLIQQFQLRRFEPRLQQLVDDSSTDPLLRYRAATTLLQAQPDSRLATLLGTLFQDNADQVSLSLPTDFAETVLALVVSRDDPATHAALEELMQRGSRAAQNRWALQLASDRLGGDALLRMINAGTASPRTIADPNVRNRLHALKVPVITEQLAKIEAEMPQEDAETLALIQRRASTFMADQHSPERGHEIFRKHCAACHRVGQEGEVVGPQLDGIGARGLARVVEDVLDPNRNVDPTFRATAVLTVDGRVLSGLIRNENPSQLELVDQAGKVIALAIDEIEERTPLSLSPMPANFGDTLPADDFADLMAFLLRQRTSQDGKQH